MVATILLSAGLFAVIMWAFSAGLRLSRMEDALNDGEDRMDSLSRRVWELETAPAAAPTAKAKKKGGAK